MATHVRKIVDADRDDLAAFFDRHPDTTLFLRGNLSLAGLDDDLHPFGGVWVGVFDGGVLHAVATHFNGGNVIVAGDAGVNEAARLAVATSQRPVRGVIGPWREARSALAALALPHPPALESREILYRLEIDRLVVPPTLASGEVRCRRSREAELHELAAWRVAFEVENLSKTPSPRQRADAIEAVTRAHDAGRHFVLEDRAGTPVAMSAFNAWADGIVQVGSVFTPRERRGRGHGRAVVAGSLLDARQRGAHRSVLFTGEENHPARRAYEALGFEAVGDYGLLLF